MGGQESGSSPQEHQYCHRNQQNCPGQVPVPVLSSCCYLKPCPVGCAIFRFGGDMAYECGHGFTPCHRLLGGSCHLLVYIENNLRWWIEQHINNTETSQQRRNTRRRKQRPASERTSNSWRYFPTGEERDSELYLLTTGQTLLSH